MEAFLPLVDVVPFDAHSAGAYGYIRAELRRIGRPAPALDLLIAASALACDATLVTDNTADFRECPGSEAGELAGVSGKPGAATPSRVSVLLRSR